MKKLILTVLLALAMITAAGHAALLKAQTGSSAAPASTGTATAAAETPQAEPAKKAEAGPTEYSAQARQPHQDYAKMEIRECTECHKAEGIGPNHDADWIRSHRVVASRSQKNCADCHDQQFCLDCHKGGGIDAKLDTTTYRVDYIPSSHRTDFIEIHPIKAHDNPQTCYRCHDARYCSECHAKFRGEDLEVLSHRRGWSDLKTSSVGPAHATFTTAQCQGCHPGGGLPKHVWSSDHAREARRNLQACQTCHSDGAVCMTCHSARQGLMINPHPRNWGSVKDKFKNKGGGRSCIKCHDNF